MLDQHFLLGGIERRMLTIASDPDLVPQLCGLSINAFAIARSDRCGPRFEFLGAAHPDRAVRLLMFLDELGKLLPLRADERRQPLLVGHLRKLDDEVDLELE